MELKTIVTMVLVLGTVWGGLMFVLTTAMRKEKQKTSQHSQSSNNPTSR